MTIHAIRLETMGLAQTEPDSAELCIGCTAMTVLTQNAHSVEIGSLEDIRFLSARAYGIRLCGNCPTTATPVSQVRL